VKLLNLLGDASSFSEGLLRLRLTPPFICPVVATWVVQLSKILRQ
jgi:hypothetical protein